MIPPSPVVPPGGHAVGTRVDDPRDSGKIIDPIAALKTKFYQ